MITSLRNPKIQQIRRLQSKPKERQKAHAFVVEGVRLVEEALITERHPHMVLHTDELSGRGRRVVKDFLSRGVESFQVTSQVMRIVSDTQTPQGLLAVMPMERRPLPEVLDLVLIADKVRDPGNFGTILRTASAVGVDVVLVPPGSVDPYAPKVIRAAMGAHFHVPIRNITWLEIQSYLEHLQVYLADATAGRPFTQVDFRSPMALIIGGEAEGASSAGENLAKVRVHIPIPGKAESLNAAIASAVLLFEVIRQRGGEDG